MTTSPNKADAVSPAIATKIFTLALAVVFSACSDRGSTQNAKSEIEKTVTGLKVAVLGGETSGAFVDGLRAAGVTHAQASAETDVAKRAEVLMSADVTIIVVDATQGPLPINREDVLLSRQFSRGPVIIAFSRSASIDDPELLDLEQLEMRDLMNTYDLPGNIAVCFDSEAAGTKLPKGFPAIAKILSKSAPISHAYLSESAQSMEASVYALADLECFKRGIAKPINNGTYRVVFGNLVVEAEIQTSKAVQPASSGLVSIHLPKPLDLHSNARFVISSQGHAIAAGAVAQIKR